MPDITYCPKCGGQNGHHGLVHVRHPQGDGGYNTQCPNRPYTAEQIIAARVLAAADQDVVEWLASEPPHFENPEQWDAWNDGLLAAENQSAAADQAYRALWPRGQAPDSRKVLGA